MPHIKFTISDELLPNVPQPKPASKYVPEWYKKIDNTFADHANGLNWANVMNGAIEKFSPNKTIKACLPVRDYLTSGYIIPAWTDIVIIRDQNGKYASVSSYDDDFSARYRVGVDWHNREQIAGSPMEKKIDGEKAVKINNPWVITTPRGYSSFLFSPYYHKNQIEILPAIVDTDRHDMPINLPCILKEDEAQIERGTPLVQVVPFKREAWNHEISSHSRDFLHNINMKLKLTAGSVYSREYWKRKFFR